MYVSVLDSKVYYVLLRLIFDEVLVKVIVGRYEHDSTTIVTENALEA